MLSTELTRVWITSDKKKFLSEAHATKHEAYLNNQKQIQEDRTTWMKLKSLLTQT